MTKTRTASAPDAPTAIDISGLPATARTLVISLVDSLSAAEHRANVAEKKAAQAETRAEAAEAVARAARAAEAAATQALADARRAHAERIAATVAARDALTAAIDGAAGPEATEAASVGDSDATPAGGEAAGDANQSAAIDGAVALESAGAAPVGDEPATPVTMDAAAEGSGLVTSLLVSDDVEELCVDMVAAGEADDRAAALAILLSEATALRRGAGSKPQAAATAAMPT